MGAKTAYFAFPEVVDGPTQTSQLSVIVYIPLLVPD